ncbi:hypothetical protein D5086_004888 [Populus alba]|uniref:Uncharacterized protein n=1 Tax=Populus alba TaxID=43335 RepID=A0ACC4CRR8_POPAL
MNCDGSSRRPVAMSLRVEDRPDEDLTSLISLMVKVHLLILLPSPTTVQTWRTAALKGDLCLAILPL